MALACAQCLPLVSPSKGWTGDKRGVRPIMVTCGGGADPPPGWDLCVRSGWVPGPCARAVGEAGGCCVPTPGRCP